VSALFSVAVRGAEGPGGCGGMLCCGACRMRPGRLALTRRGALGTCMGLGFRGGALSLGVVARLGGSCQGSIDACPGFQ
jgi:hypothetical protein